MVELSNDFLLLSYEALVPLHLRLLVAVSMQPGILEVFKGW